MSWCPASILVCFADPSESKHLRRIRPDIPLLHTGMGPKNARQALERYLATRRPDRLAMIISSGFAGGLNPDLPKNQLVVDVEQQELLPSSLPATIRPGSFHSVDRIAITQGDKTLLWNEFGRDAVEMESSAIKEVARSYNIECLTLRIISDTAGEDLPLDFNALMTSEMKLSLLSLTWSLITKPTQIPGLARFGKSVNQSAIELGEALSQLIPLADR